MRPTARPTLPARAAFAVMALAALAALAGLFTLPVLDRDEARYAQATAQMLESGDPVRIHFQDEPRHKKPIAIHWLQAASVALTSGENSRAIWAWRLPSLVAAMLAALAVFLAGEALFGWRAGFAAGSLFAVTSLLATEAAIAKTDAALAAACAFAFLSLVKVRLAADRPDDPGQAPRLWAVTGWVAVAAGTLIKGPVAPMAMGLAVLSLTAMERRADWWRAYFYWPGPVMALLVVGPWIAAIEIATGGTFLREAFGQDIGPKIVSGHEGHGAPPGLHTVLLPVLFWPAIAGLPAGIALAWGALRRGGEPAPGVRLALAWAIPLFVLFELMPTKLVHYTLPAYPGLAVLAGWGLARIGAVRALPRALGAGLVLAGSLAAAGVMIATARWFDGPQLVAALAGAGVLIVTLAGALALLRAQPARALVLCLIAALGWHAAARGIVLPRSDALFVTRSLVQTLEESGLRAGGPAILSTYTEPSLVFALGGEVELLDMAELDDALARTEGPALVLIDMARFAQTAQTGEAEDGEQAGRVFQAVHDASCARSAVNGFNYSRGNLTSIAIYRVGGCRETRNEP